MKDAKLYVLVVTLSAKNSQKLLENVLAKYLKDQLIGMSIKQKVRIKIQQKNIDILGIKFCWC